VRILHVIHRYPPAIGGSESWCAGIARWQADHGHEVTVLTLRAVEEDELWDGAGPGPIAVGGADLDGGVRIVRYAAGRPGTTLRAMLGRLDLWEWTGALSGELAATAARLARTADIVHAHTVPLAHTHMAWLAARLARRPFVLTPHFHAVDPVHGHASVRWLLRHADRVFVMTAAERAALAAHGVPADRIVEVTNAIEPVALDATARESTRRALGVDPSVPLVCFLGRKARTKGIDVLFAALPLVRHRPAPVLVLAGPSTTWYRTVSPPACDARIIDVPTLPETAKSALLAAADLLVLPSRHEAFGIVFLEAWAAGTAVLGTDVPAVREAIRDAGTTFRADDPTDLAARIDAALADPEERARQVMRGRLRIETSHTWDRVGPVVEVAYRDVLARGARMARGVASTVVARRVEDARSPAVLEDFRRDALAAPVAWHVESDANAEAVDLAQAISSWVQAAGHVLVDAGGAGVEVPDLWCPAAHVHVHGHGAPPPSSITPFAVCIEPGGTAPDTRDVPRLCRAIADDARQRAFARIVREHETPPAPECAISVVVCTFRRPAALAAALASIAAQTLPPDAYEVLVVNNDPADAATASTVSDVRDRHFADRPDRLRLVGCPFRGLSFARNAGIGAAQGAIVTFVDDDAVARPDWLARLRDAFATHPDAGVIGGRVTLDLPTPRPRWAKPGWGRYWSECATHLTGATVVSHWWDYPFGANWSARRSTLVAIGGFRTRYGRSGTDAAGGEEIVAAALVERLGQTIVVEPAAEVLHRPDPSRFTLGNVWRRIQAAKREELAQERDGYLPRALTPGSILRSITTHVRRATISRGLPRHVRLEELMHAVAEARLLSAVRREAKGPHS
jgi:glycosyltransferase involved in cell wall biosynthesis